jgi:hypothetical protein
MQHLNEEQLVLHHYHDGDAQADAEQHLAACDECRAQLTAIRGVLALVDELPIPDRGDRYGDEVWTRLRWKLGAPRRLRTWQASLAAAAMLAVAFIAGVFWHARSATAVRPAQEAHVNLQQPAKPAAFGGTQNERVFVLFVGDHLDNSERMLTELANADSKHGFDIDSERERAGELVATNRIYRQTALQQGDERIASLLSDIEPILTEIAHADARLTPEELASMQKRIESKGLLFKVRVISAQVSGTQKPPAATSKGNSL